MSDALQPILSLLDEGLSLYRRNFVGFLLITASWFVPVAIAAGLVSVGVSWLDSGWLILLVVGAALLILFPLLIYLVGGLSRAAAAAAEGRPVRFREAMAIRPLRAAGMALFTIFYAVVAQVATSIVSMACVCPLYIGGIFVATLLSAASPGTGVGALIIAGGVFLIGIYGSMALSGATGSGLFYGLQPWVQESRPLGETLGRSLELIGYRFWRNLVVWLLAALLVAAAGTSVAGALGTLLPLALAYALGENAVVVQALSFAAWLVGAMVVLPPLPIWMALLYRRNNAAREGADLQAKVQEWMQAEPVSPKL